MSGLSGLQTTASGKGRGGKGGRPAAPRLLCVLGLGFGDAFPEVLSGQQRLGWFESMAGVVVEKKTENRDTRFSQPGSDTAGDGRDQSGPAPWLAHPGRIRFTLETPKGVEAPLQPAWVAISFCYHFSISLKVLSYNHLKEEKWTLLEPLTTAKRVHLEGTRAAGRYSEAQRSHGSACPAQGSCGSEGEGCSEQWAEQGSRC